MKINPKLNAKHNLILSYLSDIFAASSKKIGANPIELQTLSVFDLGSKMETGIEILVNDLPNNNEVPIYLMFRSLPIFVNKNLITAFYA